MDADVLAANGNIGGIQLFNTRFSATSVSIDNLRRIPSQCRDDHKATVTIDNTELMELPSKYSG